MATSQDVTGKPRWDQAREAITDLRKLPPQAAEAEVESRLLTILKCLFPALRYPAIATQFPSGQGPIDVYCRNAVFETKRQGKNNDARTKPDGSPETPKDQALRYLRSLAARPDLFSDPHIRWQAGVTDGKTWSFYNYIQEPQPELILIKELSLQRPEDEEILLDFLYGFIDRTARMAPPTDNPEWIEEQTKPFLRLAAQFYETPAYAIKNALWRDLLKGAFLTPPEDTAAERDLFTRHTMLVVTARAIADALLQNRQQNLTDGFAAWLLDAAGVKGQEILDDLTTEVNRYDWSLAGRDTLKDLYHSVIPRSIRHDFGEYYTPDWLARAICEEVMDPDWRQEVLELAIAKKINGPAVLDPACGSGTFLYHATQLLLSEAAKHPALAQSPHAQVEIVNKLVAGMDLHPVAVELAKTTKIAALSALAFYANADSALNIHLGVGLVGFPPDQRPYRF